MVSHHHPLVENSTGTRSTMSLYASRSCIAVAKSSSSSPEQATLAVRALSKVQLGSGITLDKFVFNPRLL